MIIPTIEEEIRCMDIRKRSKRGGLGDHVSQEEHEFCRDMVDKYEEWYGKTEPVIFNATVPFGSNASREVDEEYFKKVEKIRNERQCLIQ